jgi:hypothetical protein
MVALMAKFVSIHRSAAASPDRNRNRSPNRRPDLSASPPRSDGIGVDASLGAVDRLYIMETRGRDGKGVYERSMALCGGFIASRGLMRRAEVCMG